jgi:hypothetical protein
MAVAEHLIATTRDLDRTLTEPDRASWLWVRLRAALELVLSFVLMPDHMHLVAPPGLRPRLRGVLSAFTARFGVRFDLRDTQIATTPAIAARMARYGFTNPLRAGLVADPWDWQWSTLRDLGGAAYPIWTPLPVVASKLRLRPSTALDALTHVAELRPPAPRLEPLIAATRGAVVSGVAAALRITEPAVLSSTLGRKLVVQACAAIAPPHAGRLAHELGCCERTIRRDLAQPHPALDAVLLCLSDACLRSPVQHLGRSRR